MIKVVSSIVEDSFTRLVNTSDLSESSSDLLIIGKAIGFSEDELEDQYPSLVAEETDEDDDSDADEDEEVEEVTEQ